MEDQPADQRTEAPPPPDGRAWHPTRLALLIGAVFGVVVVVVSPPFAAPDEATHFFRAYQLSEGRIFARNAHGGAGGTLPGSVIRDVSAIDRAGPAPSVEEIVDMLDEPTGGRRRWADFRNTAVYPPVAYAPAAAAILVGRLVGLSTVALMYAARLADLAVFLALIAAAARRFPRSSWIPWAVALLPSTLFLAGSVSADPVTIGLCALVVSDALGDGPVRRLAITSLLLGLAKPPYFVVSLLALYRWVRDGRSGRWLPAATGASWVLALAWSRWSNHLFVPYRPIIRPFLEVEPGEQLVRLVTHPWDLVTAAVLTARTDVWMWFGQAAAPFGRNIDVAAPLAVAAWVFLTVVVLVAPRHAGTAEQPFDGVVAVGVALATLLATVVAVYLYSNAVGASRIELIYGRYVLPLLPAMALVVPQPRLLRELGRSRPIAVDVAIGTVASVLLIGAIAAIVT